LLLYQVTITPLVKLAAAGEQYVGTPPRYQTE
jgi:hypothetical protein